MAVVWQSEGCHSMVEARHQSLLSPDARQIAFCSAAVSTLSIRNA
jgi:hypothetical protein